MSYRIFADDLDTNPSKALRRMMRNPSAALTASPEALRDVRRRIAGLATGDVALQAYGEAVRDMLSAAEVAAERSKQEREHDTSSVKKGWIPILEALRRGKHRPMDVQVATGLSKSRVSTVLRELADAGLARQAPQASGQDGRGRSYYLTLTGDEVVGRDHNRSSRLESTVRYALKFVSTVLSAGKTGVRNEDVVALAEQEGGKQSSADLARLTSHEAEAFGLIRRTSTHCFAKASASSDDCAIQDAREALWAFAFGKHHDPELSQLLRQLERLPEDSAVLISGSAAELDAMCAVLHTSKDLSHCRMLPVHRHKSQELLLQTNTSAIMAVVVIGGPPHASVVEAACAQLADDAGFWGLRSSELRDHVTVTVSTRAELLACPN